jgi:hypothetical protein
MEQPRSGSEASFINNEFMDPEIESSIMFYVDEALLIREKRDELKSDPTGTTVIDSDFSETFFKGRELSHFLGQEVELPIVLPNTHAEMSAVALLEAGIIDGLQEANSLTQEIIELNEIEVADKLAKDKDWTDQDTRYYADCDLKTWEDTSIDDRWRKLAYHARYHEYIRGVPNYFRYYAGRVVGSDVEMEPIRVRQVIDINKFLGRDDDEPGTMLENGFDAARQFVSGGLQALRRVVDYNSNRAPETKANTTKT